MKVRTADDVRGLWSAATSAAALGAAMETGLLWMLEETPRQATEIVCELGIPGNRGYYWLQVLETSGVLDETPLGYTPSQPVREAILQTRSRESWMHLAIDERERVAGVSSLGLYIREPGSILAAQGLPRPVYYVDRMRSSPARAREFTRMLFEVHQALAESVADLLDITGVERVMDLGGNSGVVSMALLRRHPGLTATVVDIDNVCVAGREIAEEQGLADRLSYHPAEFSRDEFPTGFDLVLKCDVGVFDEWLFEKIWRSLKPGGRVAFVERLPARENRAPEPLVEWTFLDSLDDPSTGRPTLAQLQAMLARVGFEVVPGHRTFGAEWLFFQALKLTAG